MPKDFEDPPKEPARKRAERKWRNYDVEKRFKDHQAKPTSPEATDLEPADIIANERPDRRYAITRAQTKFGKEIREMLEGHSRRNLLHYVIAIRAQRKRLLLEKLRRLEAAQRVNGGANV